MEPATQLALIALIVILVAAYIFFNYNAKPSSAIDAARARISENLTKMRRLWTESSYLTRSSVVEGISGYLGANATNERILANANQVGRNLGNLYGSSNGDRFATLLRDRHLILQNVIVAARQNKDFSDEAKKLKANTQEIVAFWTDINTTVDGKKLECLLDAHADHTLRKITHISKQESIAGYNSFDSSNKTLQELMDYFDEITWKNLVGAPRY